MGRESIRVTRSVSIDPDEIELARLALVGAGRPAREQGGDPRRGGVRRRGVARRSRRRQKRRVVAKAGPVLRAVAQDERSQARNRELAVERLVAKLAEALRVERRRVPTTPTAASRERRLETKRRRATVKRRPSASARRRTRKAGWRDTLTLTPPPWSRCSRGRFGRPYLWSASCGSTQDVLRGSALPEGAVAVTEHQTSGRGRVGRRWEDTAGRALLLSVLLRPPAGAHAQQLSLVAGLAVAETVEEARDARGRSSGRTTCCSAVARSPGSCSSPPARTSSAGSGVNVSQTEAELPAGTRLARGVHPDGDGTRAGPRRRCSSRCSRRSSTATTRGAAWGSRRCSTSSSRANALRGRPSAVGGVGGHRRAHRAGRAARAPTRRRDRGARRERGVVESRGAAEATPRALRGPAQLDVLEAEAALDAEVAARDVVVGGARHLDDPVVLHVELEGAADAAVGADRLGDCLLVLAPLSRLRAARARSGT